MLGVVGNGTAQMAYSRAVTSWFDRRRGVALALVMSGGAIGAIVLPPLAAGAHPIRRLARRVPRRLAAWRCAIGMPAVALFIRERPARDRRGPRRATRLARRLATR